MFIKSRRYTNKIVVLSTKTDEKQDIGFKELDRKHRDKGCVMCGFHYIIRRDGMIETGRELDQIGNWRRHLNKGSVYVCLVGDEDNFTKEQMDSLDEILEELMELYPKAAVTDKTETP